MQFVLIQRELVDLASIMRDKQMNFWRLLCALHLNVQGPPMVTPKGTLPGDPSTMLLVIYLLSGKLIALLWHFNQWD